MEVCNHESQLLVSFQGISKLLAQIMIIAYLGLECFR